MEEDFVLTHHGILESEHYVVHVGTVPGDKVPQYLVFHKEYGVLEYAHNNIVAIHMGLEELEERLEEVLSGKKSEKPVTPQGSLFN